jgi:FixJ family two-component response regulator
MIPGDVPYHSAFNRDRLVHILDPDPTTCEALSVLFRLEGFQTAFSLETANFYASLERRPPDGAVVNVQVGPEDGISVLRRLKSLRSGIVVVMLSDKPQVELAVRAMKTGAEDVITKPIDTEHLVQSVLNAFRQDVHLGAAEGGIRPVEVRGFPQLTLREREVLQRITNGRSNKEAGLELGISPRTIEVHRARIMQKLGARNTADLMRIILTR